MFEPTDAPRVYGLAPGVDFPQALIDGLLARLAGQPPEALGRVEVFVNTRRMQRRIKTLFDSGPAMLLPRLRLVTDLAADSLFADLPPPISPLRRRLELTQLVSKLLETEPELAPRSALFDLADSLAELMDEMRGEGVTPEEIRSLDVTDESGHWQRSLKFVALVDAFYAAGTHSLDPEARQRLVIERLAAHWAEHPPGHPVIVAGSTGSRGATALFMKAVSRLPQGAVILPGVDFDLPDAVWGNLDDAMAAEDHPQFRFARLMKDLGQHPRDIRPWRDVQPPSPARNRLVSLALRPAPVTDQWLTEGRRMEDLAEATADMTLIEAPSSRAEASAIALIIRRAVEDGVTAALITPDRTLSRQVTAALDRWGIEPDDSAGKPLPLSPPGRFLRHVADRFGQVLSVDALLTLLKHPLTASGRQARGLHLLHTRELELHLRRYGPAFPAWRDLQSWAGQDADRQTWAAWIGSALDGLEAVGARPLSEHLENHIQIAECLAAGPAGTGSGGLWDKAAGREARRWVGELRREAEYGGTLSPFDYASLFLGILQKGEVREPTRAHPGAMIWGTLESRVQGARLVVLGGLNEGVWPETPKSDPWLNRKMRDGAGLLLPERRIGLAAHDFQQAVAAEQVVLTRSVRDAEAQTVPSRWLNRLGNLLGGLPEQGMDALKQMQARGTRWLDLAELLDAPTAPAPASPRPSPRPPVAARPREISITEVQTLIRDPYAVYARRILGLASLDPLRRQPDAPLRGTLIHKILERFIDDAPVQDPVRDRDRLMEVADVVFAASAPWPAARRLWWARLRRVADWFVETEIVRQGAGKPIALEVKARMTIEALGVDLYGKIDRIDELPDGRAVVYDYKSGAPPSPDVQEHFDKQLLLSALLLESGAVAGRAPMDVAQIAYIGFGGSGTFEPVAPGSGEISATKAELTELLTAYADRSRGYTSRRAVDRKAFEGDYDHLARLGEWDESTPPSGMAVG